MEFHKIYSTWPEILRKCIPGTSLGIYYINRLLNVLYWLISLYLLSTIDLLILHTVLSAVLLFSPDPSFLSFTPTPLPLEHFHVAINELYYCIIRYYFYYDMLYVYSICYIDGYYHRVIQ